MSETKTNAIETELRKKVQKKLRKQARRGLDVIIEDMPGFCWESIKFNLYENAMFNVRGLKNDKDLKLEFNLNTNGKRLEDFIYSVLSQSFEEKLLDQEIKNLIKKATFLDD